MGNQDNGGGIGGGVEQRLNGGQDARESALAAAVWTDDRGAGLSGDAPGKLA
jgi:hypothetical protein